MNLQRLVDHKIASWKELACPEVRIQREYQFILEEDESLLLCRSGLNIAWNGKHIHPKLCSKKLPLRRLGV